MITALVWVAPVWAASIGITPYRQTYVPPQPPKHPWVAATPDNIKTSRENLTPPPGVKDIFMDDEGAVDNQDAAEDAGGIGDVGGIGQVGAQNAAE